MNWSTLHVEKRLALRFQHPKISQERLRAFVGMQNSIKLLKREFEREAQSLLEEVLAGAPIEEGVHRAEVVTTQRHGTKKQKLRVR